VKPAPVQKQCEHHRGEKITTKHAKGAKMMSEKVVFKEQSYRVIGVCFEVYKEKGNGFLEAVYQECLARELAEREIPFEEKPFRVFRSSKNRKPVYSSLARCFTHVCVFT
jgi:hypothetical protein